MALAQAQRDTHLALRIIACEVIHVLVRDGPTDIGDISSRLEVGVSGKCLIYDLAHMKPRVENPLTPL